MKLLLADAFSGLRTAPLPNGALVAFWTLVVLVSIVLASLPTKTAEGLGLRRENEKGRRLGLLSLAAVSALVIIWLLWRAWRPPK